MRNDTLHKAPVLGCFTFSAPNLQVKKKEIRKEEETISALYDRSLKKEETLKHQTALGEMEEIYLFSNPKLCHKLKPQQKTKLIQARLNKTDWCVIGKV